MPIFGNDYGISVEEAGLNNINSLIEAYIIDDVSRMSFDQLDEFCAPGGTGEQLVEASVLRKKTLVRLSKADDLERRLTMAAMQLAKEANDPLWEKLAKNRVKEKELLTAIRKKYGVKAEKLAKVGQKEYVKFRLKMPASFMKAGGADRVN